MSSTVFEQQFLAAMGIEHHMNNLVKDRLSELYHQALLDYQREIRYERARLMRAQAVDYVAVRRLDGQLDEVTQFLHKLALERTLRGE